VAQMGVTEHQLIALVCLPELLRRLHAPDLVLGRR
jgi:hypothetical protein